jgi:hypothetical protein
MARPDWALIFLDDAGLLLVRRDAYPEVAARFAYELLTPDVQAMSRLSERALADSLLAARLDAELRRARGASPHHARATYWLGLQALARRDPRTALPLLEEVRRLAPATPGLAFRMGLARELAGDRRGAIESYRQALREPADAAAARQALKDLGGAR